MKTWQRFALLGIPLLLQCLYFPTNQLMQGGTVFKTALDSYIPILPAWTVVYLSWFPFVFGGFCLAALKFEEPLFRAFFRAASLSILTGILIFIFFPTYMERPPLVGDDWATNLLRWVYSHDGVYNAFPSGHVYIATVIALFLSRWKPALRPWLFVYVGMIILSTLFTGQHFLPDPIGGLLLAWVVYRVGLWSAGIFIPKSLIHQLLERIKIMLTGARKDLKRETRSTLTSSFTPKKPQRHHSQK